MTIAEKIAVMTAFAAGEQIEARSRNYTDTWDRTFDPSWNWLDFDYRIVRQPLVVKRFTITNAAGESLGTYRNRALADKRAAQKAGSFVVELTGTHRFDA